jgi:signal transduction histidine kinase
VAVVRVHNLANDRQTEPGTLRFGGEERAEDAIDDVLRNAGPGVTPDVLDKMFSPFFTTKPQGSGLGLAIVRKIVDAHDGRIDVGARPGGGTVFRVTLPVRSQQQFVVS